MINVLVLLYLLITPIYSTETDTDKKSSPKWVVVEFFDRTESNTGDQVYEAQISVPKNEMEISEEEHSDQNHHDVDYEKPDDHDDDEHHDDGKHDGHISRETKNEIWFWTCTINGVLVILLFAIAYMRKKVFAMSDKYILPF